MVTMGVFQTSTVLFLLLSSSVRANVEKTIFVAPSRQPVLDASVDNLLLVPLSPRHTTARTWLNATFPTTEAPQGTDTWMLLEGLSPGSRYELRICWLATQPTAFNLFTHTVEETFESPALLSSLAFYSNMRHSDADPVLEQHLQIRKHKPGSSSQTDLSSLLFLQISAAADYYSLNRTLMEHVPPVFVDVILDQYTLNLFPQSLIPTAGYIVVLTIASWLLSGVLWGTLRKILRVDDELLDRYKKIS